MPPTTFPDLPPQIPGLTISVGSFLPRILMPSSEGVELSPIDMVEPGALGVCIYNPAPVNPLPLPPPGMDYPSRLALLDKRGVSLFIISGQAFPKLESWRKLAGLEDMPFLCDVDRAFAAEVGIPIKRLENQHFRTHAALILQEDRVLAILLETDLAHNFEGLLPALDMAEAREPGEYDLPDQPTY
jgi:hypothetical protein